MRFRSVWSAAVALVTVALAVLLGGAAQGVVQPTSAAWTDRTAASAVVTAGRWQTTPTSSCVAYGWNGAVLPGCTLSGITYDEWGVFGQRARNYYASFSVPSGTRSVSFDIDLSTATGKGTAWAWDRTRLVPGGQFTPKSGWTCTELPRVRGTGADWQNPIFFQIVERPAGSTCS
jgi:hypothetical protein